MYRNLHNVNLLIQIFLRTYIEMIYWSGTLELGFPGKSNWHLTYKGGNILKINYIYIFAF